MPRIFRAREQAELLLPWRVARPANGMESRDPINDPHGYLDNEPYNYDDLVRRAVGHVEGANPEQHFRGRVWYPAAHTLFHDVSRRVKGGLGALSRNVTVASAFSPKTSWGNNIQQAIHFLLHYDGDPAKRHDWQSANIHPEALAKFRQTWQRDPQATVKDLNRLANQHLSRKQGGDLKGFEVLRDPAMRKEWMDNIQHRGINTVLDRHDRQVKAQTYAEDGNGNPVYVTDETGQPVLNRAGNPLRQKKAYNPQSAMGHVGIPTLGENIGKAKAVWNDVTGKWAEKLGDLKTRSFHDNIVDDTPLREARTYAQAHQDVMNHNPGLPEEQSPYFHQANDPTLAHQKMEDDEGYYQMPTDPETGRQNWKLSKDLRSTCDTQHSRAMTMDHGDWKKTDYEAPAALATGPGYQLYSKAVYDATDQLNSKQLDPGKHLLPKQVQAIIWGKHKDENDYFGKQLGLVKQMGRKFMAPLRKAPNLSGKLGPDANPHYTDDWNDSGLTPTRTVKQRGQQPQVIEDPMDTGRRGEADWENAPNYVPESAEDTGPVRSHRDISRGIRNSMRQLLGAHDEHDFPFSWDDHLNDWIARRYPHRVHPSWVQRLGRKIGSRIARITGRTRRAAYNWTQDAHRAQALADDGHELHVRYPWGEWQSYTDHDGSPVDYHTGNPRYEWRHVGDGQTIGTGLAGSLDEARQAAEASHRDVAHWNPDEDVFDPREFEAVRDPLLASVADVLNYSASIEKLTGIQDDKYPQEWMDKAQELAHGTGGFTIHDDPNLPGDAPSTGYQVAIPGHEDTSISTGQGWADWAHNNQDILRNNAMGTWKGDDGLFYTEPSQTIHDYDDAKNEMLNRDQWSMWDNGAYTVDPITQQRKYLPQAEIPRDQAANEGIASATGFTLSKKKKRP